MSDPATTTPVNDAPPAPAEGAPPAVAEGAAPTTPPATEAAPASSEAPKAAETKAEGEPAKDEPKGLELKLPDGFVADAAALESFKATAAELGLDAPKAQRIVDQYVAMEAARAKADEVAFAQQQQKWVAASKADPDIGGREYEANVKLAQRALAHFGGPEVAKVLEIAGLGDHPGLLKAFVKVGRAMAEDSLAGTASQPSAAVPDPKAQRRAMYPTMHKET